MTYKKQNELKSVDISSLNEDKIYALDKHMDCAIRYRNDDPDWYITDIMQDEENYYRPVTWKHEVQREEYWGGTIETGGWVPDTYEVLVSKKDLLDIIN